MILIDYNTKSHKQIINSCVYALKQGKAVVYPTDTSYGLAVDATNIKAIKKLYKIKGRNFDKPVSVVVPSVAYAKNIVRWNSTTSKLAKRFWPGPITLVLGLRATCPPSAGASGDCRREGLGLRKLSAGGYLGIRMSNNKIALDLSRALKKPITATSANLAGKPDCYSAKDVLAQFSAKGARLPVGQGSAFGGKKSQFKPDIIINAGKLPKRKPSTIVKINGDRVDILRQGPITEKQIIKLTKMT